MGTGLGQKNTTFVEKHCAGVQIYPDFRIVGRGKKTDFEQE